MDQSTKKTHKANEFLTQATKEMEVKAKLRDQPEGERNMAKLVAAYNAVTGASMTEQEGWLFMVLLKIVRAQTGGFNFDDYVDSAAYISLWGESKSNEQK